MEGYFYFILDKKVSCWNREKYQIKAETQEEAIEIMKTIFDGKRRPEDYITPYFVEFIETDRRFIEPTMDGEPTKELMLDLGNGHDIPICDNALPPIK